MTHLVGIDIGTTTLKAVLLDVEKGKLKDCASLPNIVHHPRPYWSEFQPQELWESAATCVRRLADRNKPLDVRAIAVASMGEAGVPIDDRGNSLYPVIAWYDTRTAPFDTFWQENLGIWRLFQITGLAIRHIFSVNKIMWLRDNCPEVTQRMSKWLCMEDFIIWKLSGEFATDYTIASRTMAFDQRTKGWSTEILDLAKLDRSVFPQVYASGTSVGQLSSAAAEKLGLSAGTPVVTGGHDHLCAALAAGLTEEGQVLDSSGTAQALLALAPTFNPSRRLFRSAFTHYPHVVAGQYVVQGGLPAAGGAIEWFARLLAGGEGNLTADAYASLFAEAAAVPPGSGGVACCPYLLGAGTPHNNPDLRGALLGLSLAHTRGHVFRSLIEAMGYSLRENIDAFESALGQHVGEVIAVGGANRAGVVKQIKADASGRTVIAPELEEATATGAALLAGIGCGVYEDAIEACSSLRVSAPGFLPDPAARATYDELYRGTYRKSQRVVESYLVKAPSA